MKKTKSTKNTKGTQCLKCGGKVAAKGTQCLKCGGKVVAKYLFGGMAGDRNNNPPTPRKDSSGLNASSASRPSSSDRTGGSSNSSGFKGNWVGAAPTAMQARASAPKVTASVKKPSMARPVVPKPKPRPNPPAVKVSGANFMVNPTAYPDRTKRSLSGRGNNQNPMGVNRFGKNDQNPMGVNRSDKGDLSRADSIRYKNN